MVICSICAEACITCFEERDYQISNEIMMEPLSIELNHPSSSNSPLQEPYSLDKSAMHQVVQQHRGSAASMTEAETPSVVESFSESEKTRQEEENTVASEEVSYMYVENIKIEIRISSSRSGESSSSEESYVTSSTFSTATESQGDGQESNSDYSSGTSSSSSVSYGSWTDDNLRKQLKDSTEKDTRESIGPAQEILGGECKVDAESIHPVPPPNEHKKQLRAVKYTSFIVPSPSLLLHGNAIAPNPSSFVDESDLDSKNDQNEKMLSPPITNSVTWEPVPPPSKDGEKTPRSDNKETKPKTEKQDTPKPKRDPFSWNSTGPSSDTYRNDDVFPASVTCLLDNYGISTTQSAAASTLWKNKVSSYVASPTSVLASHLFSEVKEESHAARNENTVPDISQAEASSELERVEPITPEEFTRSSTDHTMQPSKQPPPASAGLADVQPITPEELLEHLSTFNQRLDAQITTSEMEKTERKTAYKAPEGMPAIEQLALKDFFELAGIRSSSPPTKLHPKPKTDVVQFSDEVSHQSLKLADYMHGKIHDCCAPISSTKA